MSRVAKIVNSFLAWTKTFPAMWNFTSKFDAHTDIQSRGFQLYLEQRFHQKVFMYIPEKSGSCGELKMADDWKCQSNFQDDIEKHPGRFLRFKDVKCFKWRCFQSVNILKSIAPLQVSIIDLYSHLRSSGSKSQHQRPFREISPASCCHFLP